MTNDVIKKEGEGGTEPPVPPEYKRKRQPYRFYKPSFLDENRMKMDVDRELESISQALLQVSEKFSMIDLNMDFDAGEIIDDINNIKSQISLTIRRLGNLEEANSELTVELNNYYNEMTGSLRHLNRVITNAQKALSESSLQLDVATNKTEEQGIKTRARLNRTDIVISDIDHALAQTNEKLEAVYETVEKEVTAQIETIKTALSEAEKAFTEITEKLEAKIDDNTASIETVKQSVVTTNESVSKLETTVNAKFTNVENSIASTDGRVTTAEGNISSNQTAIANSNKAFAEYKTDVTAKFDEQEAFIRNYSTTMFDYNGNGLAKYQVKAGVNYKGIEYFAGQTISAELKGGIPKTSIAFEADSFEISSGSGANRKTPFKTVGNNVFLEGGVIEDSSIIGSKIKDSEITNSKIGGFIQSNNYVAGSSGWNINKSGTAEFQNAKIRGELTATSGTMNNVTINDSCVIKGTLTVGQIKGDIVKVVSLNVNSNTIISPEPYDRRIVISIVKIYGNKKRSRVSLNGEWFVSARCEGRSLPSGDFVMVPDFDAGSTILKANTVGTLFYNYEGDDRFDAFAQIFKA